MQRMSNDVQQRLNAVREALEVVSIEAGWFEAADARWQADAASSIQQVDETLDTEDLTARSEPLLIRDFAVTQAWAAVNDWDPNFLAQHHPEHAATLRVGEPDGEPVRLSLSDMIAYCEAGAADRTPLYLWDYEFGERAPALLDGYSEPTTILPPPDLMSLMGVERPPFRWFAVGTVGSGCDVHQDPINTCAWNVLVHGRKRWALLHPSLSAEDVGVDALDDDAATAEWFLEVLPTLASKHGPTRVRVVDQPPGSLLYVPSGWWHATWNLSRVSIAVTHNLVGWTSFASCWARVRSEAGREQAEDGGRTEHDAEASSHILNRLAAEYGLVDSEQAARWLEEIARYAGDKGLAPPEGASHILSSWRARAAMDCTN